MVMVFSESLCPMMMWAIMTAPTCAYYAQCRHHQPSVRRQAPTRHRHTATTATTAAGISTAGIPRRRTATTTHRRAITATTVGLAS